jgi:hypothetical protein
MKETIIQGLPFYILTERELSRLFEVSQSTIHRYVKEGYNPYEPVEFINRILTNNPDYNIPKLLNHFFESKTESTNNH